MQKRNNVKYKNGQAEGEKETMPEIKPI